MPKFQFVEHHAIEVPAPAETAYRMLLQTDFGRSRVIRALFRLRGLGPRFQTARGQPMRVGLQDFVRAGFLPLGDRPGEEIALGLLRGPGRSLDDQLPIGADEFASFAMPGFVKIAMDFRFTALGPSSSLVSTETRVFAVDDAARRSFARYWRLIRPFSALIRRRMLALLRSELTSLPPESPMS